MKSLMDEIQDESRAYTNLTMDELSEAETEELHERLSRLLNQLERNEDNKRLMASAYGTLIKKIKADIRAINRAIRDRSGGETVWEGITVETSQPKLDSGLSA